MGELVLYALFFFGWIAYEIYKAAQGEVGTPPEKDDLAPTEMTIDDILEQYLEPKKKVQTGQARRKLTPKSQVKPQAATTQKNQPKPANESAKTINRPAETSESAKQKAVEGRKTRKIAQVNIEEYEQKKEAKQTFKFNIRDAVIYDIIMHRKY